MSTQFSKSQILFKRLKLATVFLILLLVKCVLIIDCKIRLIGKKTLCFCNKLNWLMGKEKFISRRGIGKSLSGKWMTTTVTPYVRYYHMVTMVDWKWGNAWLCLVQNLPAHNSCTIRENSCWASFELDV